MKSLLPFLFLVASPAIAECPVAADLARGVTVTESDGTTNRFTALGGGVVQNDGTAPFGYTYRNILAQGTHLVELGDTEDGAYVQGSRRIITYPAAHEALPIPQESSVWNVETTIEAASGDYSETQVQRWGAMTSLQIGECTYDMIPGKVTYTNSDFVVFEGLYYLPALELALLHSYQVQGEAADNYVAVRIEADK